MEEKIFDFDEKGWYEQYFSYAFTEDVYQIALRLSKKLIDSIFHDNQDKAKTLKETFDTFYSFQERAKVSSLNYRDHLLHQFQVFLIGLKIMSSRWWYENVIGNSDKNTTINTYGHSWGIVSIFHDIGYPFEKLEHIKRKYIETLLLLHEDSVPIDKVSQDILLGRLNKTSEDKELLELFYDMLNLSLNSLSVENQNKERFYWFFKKLFVEERIHAVTSALYIHHNILDGTDCYDKSEIISAILLHDKRVWMEELKSKKKIKFGKLKNIVSKINEGVDKIVFNDYLKRQFECEKYPRKINKFFRREFTQEKIDDIKCSRIKKLRNIVDSYFKYSKLYKEQFSNFMAGNISGDISAWLFVFHRIFPRDSLLCNHDIEWTHKINPKEHPMQFLLLLSDAIQERGRDLGEESVSYDYSPEICFENGENNKLDIKLKVPNTRSKENKLELLKAYVDLCLLKNIFGKFYNINISDNEITITLKKI